MFFDVIGLFIMILSLFRYKKAFLIYLLYKLVLVQNIVILAIPGIPILQLSLVMSIWFIMLYPFKMKKEANQRMDENPLRIPFLFFILVWFLAMVFSISGFANELTRYILNISEKILLIWLCWNVVQTKEDFRFLYKGITMIIFCTCLYGLFEYVLKINPLQQYEMSLMSNDNRTVNYTYDTVNRGYRISSVFSHPIGAGLTWALYIIATLTLKIRYRKNLPNLALVIITVIIAVVCVFLTKMRSPLLFMLLSIPCFLSFKNNKTVLSTMLVVIISIIMIPLLSKNQIFMSLFNSQSALVVKGSSLDQRITQFVNAWQLVKDNLITGLGAKFQDALTFSSQIALSQNLLGLESLWLNDLVKFGVLGIISDVVWFYYLLVKLPLKYKNFELFILAFAYLVTVSITSTPGFQIYLLYLFIFYLIKHCSKIREVD